MNTKLFEIFGTDKVERTSLSGTEIFTPEEIKEVKKELKEDSINTLYDTFSAQEIENDRILHKDSKKGVFGYERDRMESVKVGSSKNNSSIQFYLRNYALDYGFKKVDVNKTKEPNVQIFVASYYFGAEKWKATKAEKDFKTQFNKYKTQIELLGIKARGKAIYAIFKNRVQ